MRDPDLIEVPHGIHVRPAQVLHAQHLGDAVEADRVRPDAGVGGDIGGARGRGGGGGGGAGLLDRGVALGDGGGDVAALGVLGAVGGGEGGDELRAEGRVAAPARRLKDQCDEARVDAEDDVGGGVAGAVGEGGKEGGEEFAELGVIGVEDHLRGGMHGADHHDGHAAGGAEGEPGAGLG